jgi:glutamyl-tRNA reductase
MTNRTDGNMFIVAGINYRKADTAIRGMYALNSEMVSVVLAKAKTAGLSEIFILSTCNRTEIYGLAPNPDMLIELLCSETAGGAADFRNAAYIRKNNRAIEHLYEVAAGLDSQILGDYEIVGQLKTAVRLSKEAGMTGTFQERLISSVLQASKEIKNKTMLSGGTVSVSFAAVQMAKNHFGDLTGRNILLLGTGKIGSNTCKNLVDYAGATNITLINRSVEKAEHLAKKYNLHFRGMEALEEEVRKADLIIAATSAKSAIVHKKHVEGSKPKLIIDLSVPLNISEDVKECRDMMVIRVDELSKMKDDTLAKRKAEVPKAKEIIGEHIREFMTWSERRRNAPLLNHLKTTLHHIHQHPCYNPESTFTELVDTRIKKVISDTARKLHVHNRKGCDYISAINQFMN